MHPSLIGFLARHAAIGIAAGWVTLGLLVATDVGQLGSLLAASAEPWAGVLLLGVGFAVTFGSAAMGAAIIGLGGPGTTGRRPPRS